MTTPNEPQNPYGEEPQNPADPFRKPEQPGPPAPQYGAPQAPQYGAPQYGAPQYPGASQYPSAPPYQGGYGPVPPPNYLVWAILSTVLCCLPLGIASIVYSSQVNTKFAQGDYAGAQASSQKAKNFAIWGAVIGLVLGVVWGVVVVVTGGMESSSQL
ncbi:CD225/dispanin family protein [Cellulomonas edaphi]|uniref:CD225/dispanin family protein n=1 Tax=Cellulomonas edaphi TaxID=3053468 RepID=A0ABT7S607_9CELL|nr:CD225/dispanin family protein [Cellulomons edaphi]MDM7831035.1 CD225/dispanin family protein [Cellulomons edaphi]